KLMAPRTTGLEAPATTAESPNPTDMIWTIGAGVPGLDSSAALASTLATIVDRCRHLADGPARLWVLVDFGDADSNQPALERPLWCAIASAMRVVQNEYYGAQIRCLALAGAARELVLDQVVDELLSPGEERELFFEEG